MKKIIRLFICMITIFVFIELFLLYKEQKSLKENIIRLHVVANSDSVEDQQLKMQLKDAIVEKLQPMVSGLANKKQAQEFILENLSYIDQLSKDTLRQLGATNEVSVSLQAEEFDTRVYDTFSLPSGLYDALRIEIGNGEGKNWWCVVFPSLCVPATSDDFQTVSTAFGFSQTLTNTLQHKNGYEIRFFFLDCLGRLENLFH